MNEEMKAKVAEWLQALESGVKTEVPAYCQEIVLSEMIKYGVLLAALLITYLVALKILHIVHLSAPNLEEQRKLREPLLVFVLFATAIALFLGSAAMIGLAKAVVAPRVVIVQHLQELVNK